MKPITKLMIVQYNIHKIDWMGFKVSKENPYTYHHLKKKEDGGEETLKNGAILTVVAHEYLNVIEAYDRNLYELLNNVLKQINQQGFMPLKRQLLAINYLLEIFEKEHFRDKTKKGKILIKDKYIKGRCIDDL